MSRISETLLRLMTAIAFAPAFVACSPPPASQEVGEPFAQTADGTDEPLASSSGALDGTPTSNSGLIDEPRAEDEDGADAGGDVDGDAIPAPDLPADALRELTYTIDGESITLVGGERRMPYMPGAASENVHRLLDKRGAFGDLNGDGVDDAAVVMINEPGGSGTFSYLAAVLAGPGGLENVATRLLGDRLEVLEINISAGVIVLGVLIHGPEDPVCCPTHETVQVYRLEGAELVGGPIEPEPKEGGAQPEG